LIANYPDYQEFNNNAALSFYKQIGVLNQNFVVKEPLDLEQMIMEINHGLTSDGFLSPK
jgi:hypothetical protein